MKTSAKHLLQLALFGLISQMPPRLEATTIVWTNTAGGNWSIAVNWEPNQVPGATDDALVTNNGTYTVLLDTDPTVESLTLGGSSGSQTLTVNGRTFTLNGASTVRSNAVVELNGGTIGGGGQFTVNGLLDWTGGSMVGNGATVIAPGATLVIAGSAQKTLNQRSVTNRGTVVWSGTGNLFTESATAFYNEPGALFDVQNDALYDRNIFLTAGSFHNAGTLRKSAASGTTTFKGIPIYNTGTIELLAGTLEVTAAFNNDGLVQAPTGHLLLSGGGTSSGEIELATNRVVQLTAGTHDLGEGSAWRGAGTYQIDGATVNATGAVGVDRLELSGGTLAGSGVLTVTNHMNWTGGSMVGNGATVIAPGATVDIAGSAQKTLNQRSVTNRGTVVWSGTGNLLTESAAAFYNEPGALFDVQNDALYDRNIFLTAGSFHNAGTLRKSAASGTTTFKGIPIYNTGTIELLAGTLEVTAAFNNDGLVQAPTGHLLLSGGGTSSGEIELATNRVVQLTAGTHDLGEGSAWRGAGTYQIDGATVNATGAVGVDRLELSGGTLAGSGVLTVTNHMNWTGGSMAGNGATVIAPGATVDIAGSAQKTLNQRSVTNRGAVVWSGTGNLLTESAAPFYNAPGALFDVQNDALYDRNIFLTAGSFHNAGTLRKSAASGTTTFKGIPIYNTGTIELLAGTLEVTAAFNNDGLVQAPTGHLLLSGGGTSSGEIELATNRVVQLTAGTHDLGEGSAWRGAGTYQIDGATVNATGAVGVDRLELSGGTLAGSGVLTVTNHMNWTGGSMAGNGATVIAPGATVDIAGSAQKTLNQRSVTNRGAVVWSGTGNLLTESAAPFYNAPGALFDVQNDALYDRNIFLTAGSFHNAGTLRKSAASGTTTFKGIPVHNSGILSAWQGILAFTGGLDLRSEGTVDVRLSSPTLYGRIHSTQSLPLAGSLSVDFLGGFLPDTGQQYDVVAAPTIGQFELFAAPAISPSLFLNILHTPDFVRLETVGPMPVFAGGLALDTQRGAVFDVQGVANQFYAVEASTNFVEWVGLETNSIPISLLWQFVDQDSLLLPYRFYRVVFVP